MSSPLESRLLRWAPGFGLIFFLALIPGLFSNPSAVLVDPAAGRHLATGRVFWKAGHVLTEDPLSFTRGSAAWIDFEWLFEAGASGLDRLMGLSGVVLATWFLFGLIPWITWRGLLKERISVPVAFIYVMGCFLVWHGHHSTRPYLFTYIFMAITVFYGFSRADSPSRFQWIFLPLLFALWSNLHAGFAAGLLYGGAFLAGGLLDSGKVERGHFVRGLLLLVCAFATFLNPHGIFLHLKIKEMVFQMDAFSFWNEFQSPQFGSGSTTGLAWLFLAGSWIFLPHRGKRSWASVLPLVVFLYFGAKSQRHVFLLLIVAALPVCVLWDRYFRESLRGKWIGFLDGLRERQPTLGSEIIWIAAITCVVVFAFFQSPVSQGIRVGIRSISPEMGVYLQAESARFKRPLTTTWNAGALLYYFHPSLRVAFDDRTDFYGDPFCFEYLRMFYLRPGWKDVLEAGNYDSAILSPSDPLVQGLELLPGWRRVYSDPVTVLYRRAP